MILSSIENLNLVKLIIEQDSVTRELVIIVDSYFDNIIFTKKEDNDIDKSELSKLLKNKCLIQDNSEEIQKIYKNHKNSMNRT